MKKLILIFVLMTMVMVSSVLALEWHATNQVTVAWNDVDKIVDTDEISYIVYSKIVGTDTPILVGETADLRFTIAFTDEGKYYIGVATKRIVADGETLESEINWSDVNGESTPDPFGVKFYAKPDQPKNLHRP